jgi:hypothetical protein
LIQVVKRDESQLFSSPLDLFEVEVSEIHDTARQDMYGDETFPMAETNFEELLRRTPLMLLTPASWSRAD